MALGRFTFLSGLFLIFIKSAHLRIAQLCEVTPYTMKIKDLLYIGPSLKKLHAHYAKARNIDAKAPVTNRSSIDIDAPAALVWQAISNLKDRHLWHPGFSLLTFEAMETDRPFSWKLDGITLRSRFAVIIPERELTWSGVFFGYKAVDRQLLEIISPHQTRVVIEESLAGFLLPLFFSGKQLRAGHEKMLTGLKIFLESANR
jgi:hypothetical protein